MDTNTFLIGTTEASSWYLLQLVDTIAWPLTLLLIVFLLRHHITKLLNLVDTIRVKGIEVSMRRQMDELSKYVAEENSQSPSEEGSLAATAHKLKSLVAISTRAAILETWAEIERKLVEAAVGQHVVTLKDRDMPLFELVTLLEKAQILRATQVPLIRQLRGLRNNVAHSGDFPMSASDAMAYVTTGLSVLANLNDQ